uniref:Uncharacterized protein n=1 Tax=Melanopsichium pennsylvanicum 4 TaxID=1398559 RepID=A0A077R8L9_9BASI|nr:putative protein [Melanopsichium pennsylvanicum 4]
MADAAQQTANLAHDLLSEIIPYPVFRILAGFSNLIYSLLGTANNPASWSSTLLPPLITFFLAYFALVTAYRTVRSMLSLAWFGIKWGAIIGGLIAIWAWWTGNMDAINSTGIAPDTGGLFGQLNSLGPLMNSLYANFPDLYAPGSTRSRSNNRQRASSSRRRTRSSMRGNQHSYSFDSKDSDDYLPGDLGSGFGAFADMFGSSSSSASSSFSNNNNYNNNELGAGGVDFASLLRTLVTEGQRQGIDALSALRAAGKVQDELRRFQDNPGAWFEGQVKVRREVDTIPDQGQQGRDKMQQGEKVKGQEWDRELMHIKAIRGGQILPLASTIFSNESREQPEQLKFNTRRRKRAMYGVQHLM